MKRCPQCDRTYSDDTISFCLADGQLLSPAYRDTAETLPLGGRAINPAETTPLKAPLSREKAKSVIRRNWIIGAITVPIGTVIGLIQLSTVPGHENESPLAFAVAGVLSGFVYGYFGWSAAWGYPVVWRWWRNFWRRVINFIKQSIHLNTAVKVLVVLFGLFLFVPLLAIVFFYFYSFLLVGFVYSLFGGGIYRFIQSRKIARA